jgi:hypothetical protein
MKLLTLTVVTFLTLCVAGANASIIVSPGNNPSGTEENVLLTLGATGTTITGVTNTSNVGVNITSSTSLVADASGQSIITAAAGSFNNITIGIASGSVFTDLIFAVDVAGAGGASCTGCLTFSANANETNNTVATVTAPGTFSAGPGTSFFTATATGGETLNSFTITSTSPLADIRQIRISGVTSGGGTGGNPVPEPSTYLLMAAGVGLIAIGRKKIRA